MLALNVAHDMRVGSKRHVAVANGPLNLAVRHNPVSFNTSIDHGLRRSEQRRAVDVALNLTIDLDQALCRHAARDETPRPPRRPGDRRANWLAITWRINTLPNPS